MTWSTLPKYAMRSLLRQRRRTWLSVIGIAVGCMIALVTTAYIRGEKGMIVRAAAEGGAGHLRIAPRGWEETRDETLRLREWEKALAAARALDGVKVAAPRARARGLLAFGTRVAGVEMTGVDPRVEQRATRYVRTVAEGRYLREDDAGAVVIGRALAEQLDVALDDDLMVTLVGRDGGLEAAMLRIVGIVDTGSRELDAAVCQVTLSELQRITDIPGAGEISILLKDANRMPRAADALRRRLPAGDEVLTWMQVAPELYGGVKMDEGFAKISIGIIVIVVLLGVMSAQLTAALERRREFAVLTALGMRAGQIARLLLVETVLLGVAGGLLGLLLAAPIVYYLATVGLNLANMMGGEVVFANIMLDPILYSDFGPWMIGYSLLTALSATLLASLYPAWFAARTDPAAAMRVT